MREIVITVGYPGCGKTTHIKQYLDKGYKRFNRDSLGHRAKLSRLHSLLEDFLKTDTTTNIVLDNTYGTRESRAEVVNIAKKYNVPIRVDWINASLEKAQFLASLRMVRKYGRLLTPEEIKDSKNPNVFGPMAQYAYRKRFEEPVKAEGFFRIDKIHHRIQLPGYTASAIIFDYDGTLRETISGEKYPRNPNDIKILHGRKEVFKKKFVDFDYVLGISNQSGVYSKKLTYVDALTCFIKTNTLLNFDIEFMFCPHKSAPPNCFCRKPAPGYGVHFIEKYKLDPAKVLFVGDMKSDETFARRCGFNFTYADNFF